MNTWHIRIQGRVQGVGFRPYVYRLAQEKNLKGIVYNDIDGVHVYLSAQNKEALQFYNELLEHAPGLAKITAHTISEVKKRSFENFQILQNQEAKSVTLMPPPDFAICVNCRKEVLASDNRRAFYPFITCTQCGSRYSLIKKLPFEREFTAMDDFEMCSVCNKEYVNPEDRRYHSQTNSCHECGIRLSLLNSEGAEIETDPKLAVKKVITLWKEGKIVAIKGIGLCTIFY
jgi:hydrogenase maturation protein HypF